MSAVLNSRDRLIETSIYITRDIFGISRSHIVPLHKIREYVEAGIYSQQLVDMLRDNPFSFDGKYLWETKRVDELVNVHIWLNPEFKS